MSIEQLTIHINSFIFFHEFYRKIIEKETIMTEINRIFKVNGKPFFPIGTETVYAGYAMKPNEHENVFRDLKSINGNSMAIPVHWDAIEPEEGKFDFSSVDILITNARKYGLKLILLWFGTWKNGGMEYVPEWIKTDPKRFRRALNAQGKDMWSLSPFCKATLESDKKAFIALMKYLKSKDSVEQTVISIQVENEPGIVGTDRDYSPEGEKIYKAPVPPDFIAAMKKYGKGATWELWQAAGAKKTGTWPEVLGYAPDAGHYMYVWHIAKFIDAVAEAGKAVYYLPMFVNLWTPPKWWTLHGAQAIDYVEREILMDLYRWATPHLETIAPDIYTRESRDFERQCDIHTRPDNPLFTTETSGDQNMFRAIAQFNAVGYHMAGIENIFDKDGNVYPATQHIANNIKCVASVIPLLLKYQGTGRIHLVHEEFGMDSFWLGNLEGYYGMVQFGPPRMGAPSDWRHRKPPAPYGGYNPDNAGRGLIIQAGKHEFYLTGFGWRLHLHSKLAPDKNRTVLSPNNFVFEPTEVHYLSVDQGYFDANGKFVTVLRRNGGQIDWGLWVEGDIGVVRVLLCD
jgi:hypothetical protein